MKCPHPQAVGIFTQQRAEAGLHFLGGLIGKCYGHNLTGGHTHRIHEIGDTVRQHAGLAAAGTGNHENGAVPCRYRRVLLFIQSIQIIGHIFSLFQMTESLLADIRPIVTSFKINGFDTAIRLINGGFQIFIPGGNP